MYRIEPTKEIYRFEPWRKPYSDRIGVLERAKTEKRKTVAFLYPQFDSSTFRYRGYNVAETLEYSLWWSGAYFELKDIPKLLKDMKNIDVLVIIRCAWDKELEEIIMMAKHYAIKLCYDIDDLIYNPKYMPIVVDTLDLDRNTEWDYWFGLTARHWLIVNMCDAIITTNGFLAEYLKKDINKPCYIIKNYLNWIQEEVSTEYFNAKQRLQTEKPFEIGYFSGSPTHVKDITVIMPEVEKFLNKHENAVLKIVGYMKLPEQYKYLEEKEKICFVPFQTFVGLQYHQAKVDVNVVPLVNNEFSNCKSELKYFETAIVGTITCATPSYTYAGAIKNGENGYLCEEGDWLPTLEKIYEQENRREQQQYIREAALKEYSYLNQIKNVESVLNSILG